MQSLVLYATDNRSFNYPALLNGLQQRNASFQRNVFVINKTFNYLAQNNYTLIKFLNENVLFFQLKHKYRLEILNLIHPSFIACKQL